MLLPNWTPDSSRFFKEAPAALINLVPGRLGKVRKLSVSSLNCFVETVGTKGTPNINIYLVRRKKKKAGSKVPRRMEKRRKNSVTQVSFLHEGLFNMAFRTEVQQRILVQWQTEVAT